MLALTIVLLGFEVASPEPRYSPPIGDHVRAIEGDAGPPLVEIESSVDKADRLNVAALQPHEATDQSPELQTAEPPPPVEASAAVVPEPTVEVSMDDLCYALLTSAQKNDLPVPFFANLIWQESRLRDDAVSRVGAMGIAQFMPQVAVAFGLENPFDPLQAIPASARMLHELRAHFGNLGFAAAAYNAGARRVSEWLEHRRALPRETRNYVVSITGRSAEDWRKTPPDDAALTFVRHLPCRGLPAYADLEQARLQVAQLQKAEAELAQTPPQTASAASGSHEPIVNRKQARPHSPHDAARTAVHDSRIAKRQAKRLQREVRGRRKGMRRKNSIEAWARMPTIRPQGETAKSA
jgi:soluble lytic murein transglycosylase-like protein